MYKEPIINNFTFILREILNADTGGTEPNAQLQTQSRKRADIAEQYKWSLEDLYESDESWNQAKQELVSSLGQIEQYQGRLAESASILLECLELNTQISKEFARLYSYAHMKSDQDMRVSKYLAAEQEMRQIGIVFNSKAAFITPEIVKMDQSTIDAFIEQQPKLKIYKMPLYDILRKRPHVLSEKQEKIMAETGLMSDASYSIFSVFSNAEMPYPKITLNDGATVELNQAGYALHRASRNCKDREAVFNAFWDTYNKFKETFGADLYANVKRNMFYARTRNYESSLHSALDQYNIPIEVYTSLIENVTNNLSSFHRYLNIKKQMLGVNTLRYSDIYAPVVKDVDLQYTYDQAQQLILDSLEPLGATYKETVQKAFKQRWIDVYPTPGKRSGAYSSGSAYDVHPYILLNYNGRYNDLSTITHELGHTMHSYYANKTQPYPTADYSIFVAEVASTFNEALLIHKMLEEIKDDDIRLSLLMNYLDGLKGTVFRQTQFAEFELKIHQKAERNEPLTGDELNKIYSVILKKYFGYDQNVCYIDDLYTVEWAYIPHFYGNFYVYQYATSFTASTALAEMVLNNGETIARKYIEFLSAGGSDYPIELLKNVGVDMTGPVPFNKTMESMNRTMDEIEAILARKGK
ncbi:oligoendopeptidase F [Planctomycetota bacterium]